MRHIVLVALVVLIAMPSCRPRKRGGDGGVDDTSGADAAGPAFTQTFTSKSGLVTMHYPKDFVANPSDEYTTFVEPTRSSAIDNRALVTFITNKNPITQDVGEYARILQDGRGSKLPKYVLVSTKKTKCWKEFDGVETEWTFEDGVPHKGRACMFLANKHGYSFAYALPVARAAKDEATLRRIVDAAELPGGPATSPSP